MRELILGTAGHIDHGKTALVRALTGVDTDRLQQEKERGISIDIGFAQLDVEGARLGIVDVPGHERFIRNMLAGACGVDVAMLVIAADDSVMPQTREHMAILRLLRIRHGLVALTKIDLVEPSWLDLVEEDIRELVEGTFLEDAPIVRTSAQTGAGLDDLKAAIGTVCGSCRPERQDGFFRMAVDRAFVLQGLGTVVTGSVWAGTVEAGTDVDWVQPGRTLRVRSVQSHGNDTEAARRGQRAALNLSGAHHTDIERGHVIAERGYMAASSLLTVRIDVLPESPWPVRHRSNVRLHVGSQETHAEVRLLRGTTVLPGESGLAQLRCSDAVACVARQPFVLRTESPVRTIGGGAVLQPVARPVSRRDAETVASLPGLLDDDPAVRASIAAAFLPSNWSLPQLCRDADLAPTDAPARAETLERDGVIVALPVSSRRSIHVHRHALEQTETRIIEVMRRLHAAEPMVAAIPQERLVSQLDYLDRDVVRGVLDRLVSMERITGDESAVALPDHAPALTEPQRRIRDGILDACRAAGFRPPSAAEMAAAVSAREDRVAPIIALCVAERELAHVGEGLYLHASWEQELRRRIVEHLTGSDGMTVSQIKDVLETSRKYAVPICEYLDRIGLTRRFADKRALATA